MVSKKYFNKILINFSEYEKYDVVIIGAGIAGIICGCFLAKEGMKTLIVEQNDRPGIPDAKAHNW